MRLAVDAGRPVAIDTLVADVWGEHDGTARRGIQVAVSAIRKALHDDGAERTVDRVDDGYVLTLPPRGSSDLDEFRAAADEVARAMSAPDRLAAAERALAAVGGELLPAAVASDWLVAARDQFAQHVARVATAGATAAIEIDDAPAAIRLAEIGLEFDRYHDELWRVVIDAHERRGDTVTAERLRRDYAMVLDELGLGSSVE
ncbi:MAG: winged helix-turn-helix domain-containing protein [Ilumatobacteraceae bacterium]